MGHVTYTILMVHPLEYLGRNMRAPPCHVTCVLDFFGQKNGKKSETREIRIEISRNKSRDLY